MKGTTLFTAVVAIGVGSALALHASDRVAVYAKVDRVVLAPATDAPTAIQIWGVFSIATAPNPRNYRPDEYQPAARGYLYYTLPSRADLARREWSDLKNVAGTGAIVAFGSRWDGVPRLRDLNEPPGTPDPYSLNMGLFKVNERTDYAPIRALIDFKR